MINLEEKAALVSEQWEGGVFVNLKLTSILSGETMPSCHPYAATVSTALFPV